MRLRSLFGLVLTSTVCACAASSGTRTISLAPEAAHVEVTTDRPPHCEVLSDVYGSFAANDPREAVKGARIDLRNRAAKLGADHVLLQGNNATHEIVGGYQQQYVGKNQVVLSGLALRCMAAPEPKPPAAPNDVRSL